MRPTLALLAFFLAITVSGCHSDAAPPAPQSDLDVLQGKWERQVLRKGKEFSRQTYTIHRNTITITAARVEDGQLVPTEGSESYTFTLNEKASPKEIDLHEPPDPRPNVTAGKILGIYKIEGDTWTLHHADDAKSALKRPKDFADLTEGQKQAVSAKDNDSNPPGPILTPFKRVAP